MVNRTPEQDLIDGFVEAIESYSDKNIQLSELINKNCRSRTFADIEYTSQDGQRWAIEAKSNDSKDAHNTVHKFFGELMKETGRKNRRSCFIGILIPECAIAFYSRLFQSIDKSKYISFGELIPIR